MVYNVTGDGRAINITYVDNGGLLQTEFNVLLPWSKEVQLAEPANSFREHQHHQCRPRSELLDHRQRRHLEQRTGAGLTICATTG